MACFMLAIATTVRGEDGSNLWLRFDNQLNNNVTGVAGVAMDELRQHWKGGAVVLKRQKKMAKDSYSITTKAGKTVIEGADNTALLYGAFHLLRLQQTGQDVSNLNISQRPAYSLRILNHWDNPNGTVERGFAGKSIFLNPTPERMKIYARANASVGINGTVLNNVNAKPEALATDNLKKVKQIAEPRRLLARLARARGDRLARAPALRMRRGRNRHIHRTRGSGPRRGERGRLEVSEGVLRLRVQLPVDLPQLSQLRQARQNARRARASDGN